jgi:hypothetical protein
MSPLSIRIHEDNGCDISLGIDSAEFAQRYRPVRRWLVDGSPKVDDLVSFLQKLGRFGCGEMEVHASFGGPWGLVDVRR